VTYTVADYANGGANGALHWYVFSGYDTLLFAKTTDVDGGNLVLSHICVGKTTPTPTPVVTPTPDPVVTPTPEPEVTPTPEPEVTPTPVPSGTVVPKTPDITSPPTDATGTPGSNTGGTGWGAVMLALGGLALASLLLRPAAKRNRR
jgi:hypothetical protein